MGELQRRGVRLRKDDNAFLWISDVEALQTATDRLSPPVICFNRLEDLGLNKGLENLNALRQKLVVVTDRLAGFMGDS